MPQATEALRKEFGVADWTVVHYLQSRGYKLTPHFQWIKPAGREPTPKELRAVDFLAQEWDYGGFVTGEG